MDNVTRDISYDNGTVCGRFDSYGERRVDAKESR
jgi:hypothetical protein